jgi:hypothetical protein
MRRRTTSAADNAVDEIVATPAAPDLVCWLWAAFPQKNGRLHIARIAAGLRISESSIRRWVAAASTKQKAKAPVDQTLGHNRTRRLRQRAILRGRGHYLWPPADETTLYRSADTLRWARVARTNAADIGPTPKALEDGHTNPREVHLLHYPRGHVYGVAVTSTVDGVSKLQRRALIVQTITVPDKWAAEIVRETALELVTEHRCIAPREFVSSGRTETWYETGPEVALDLIAADLDFLPLSLPTKEGTDS